MLVWAAVGGVRSSAIALISSPSSSGFPPVAVWQARANASSGSTPSRSPIRPRTPSSLRPRGLITVVTGSPAISASIAASAPGSLGRVAATSRIGTPSSLRTR